MKRIILFRFHKSPVICKNRLRLLKKLNPGVQIFGLFGGPEKDYKKIQQRLGPYLENIYGLQGKTGTWKWRNGDLSIRLWYKNIGRDISFDMLHVIEWDLVLFDSLDKIYKDIPKDGVGFGSLTLLKDVKEKWWWFSEPSYKKEWEDLLGFVKDKFNYNQKTYASNTPGLCLPEEFLERYSNTEIPELCHDELRLPLFGQIFGFKLYDIGFYKRWFNENEEGYFNCNSREINPSITTKELAISSGRRVFHPFRKMVIFNWFDRVINLSITAKDGIIASHLFRKMMKLRQEIMAKKNGRVESGRL